MCPNRSVRSYDWRKIIKEIGRQRQATTRALRTYYSNGEPTSYPLGHLHQSGYPPPALRVDPASEVHGRAVARRDLARKAEPEARGAERPRTKDGRTAGTDSLVPRTARDEGRAHNRHFTPASCSLAVRRAYSLKGNLHFLEKNTWVV